MITYTEILDSFTIRLNKKFPQIDIYTTETIQGIGNDCFIVQLLPISRKSSTLTTDTHSIVIEIKYLTAKSQSKLIFYDKLNELQDIFSRGIKVGDRFIKFDFTESDIYKDDVGYILSFLINITYEDETSTDEEWYKDEDYVLMRKIYLNKELTK